MNLSQYSTKLVRTARVLASSDRHLVMNWATADRILRLNWGDKLNVYLGERLSGRKVVHRADVYPAPGIRVHYAVGSHLASALSEPSSVAWGCGFISANVPFRGYPAEIRAVRGYLSSERLRRERVASVDVVGDPALLLPLLYTPPQKKKYRIGIVPHYSDWFEPFVLAARRRDDVLVIDITGGIEEVVDQICSCEKIVSSSLHGIICADAYGVPSRWISLAGRMKGDGFKFRDYFSSVGRSDVSPVPVTEATDVAQLEDLDYAYSVSFDSKKLLDACPFLEAPIRTPELTPAVDVS